MYDAPLSAKQEREDAKLRAQLEREQIKLAAEEARKDELHRVKVGGALGSVAQSAAQKDDKHQATMKELGVKPKAPLGGPTNSTEKVMAANIQELSLPQPSGKIPTARVAADAAGIRGLLADPNISPDTRKIYEQSILSCLRVR